MFFDGGGLCPRVEQALAQIPGGLRLGVRTAAIRRNPGPSDLVALARLCRWLDDVEPHVVHGHGSKGGALARLSRVAGAAPNAVRAYTPHGGSFNYRPGSGVHRLYMAVERLLAPQTDAFLFESAYIESRFDACVGAKSRLRRVVLNGLRPAEFLPVAPNAEAAEFFYVGELRREKGVDALLEAAALLSARTPAPRFVLVGAGPEKDRLVDLARRLGISDRLSFPGPMPFREAMALGRILVVPSRAESLPYVVLEGAAAAVPMVATDVGGIPEIFGRFRDRLGPAGDAADLARRLSEMLAMDPGRRADEAAELRRAVAGAFTIEAMADAVLSSYREALALRREPPVPAAMGLLPRAGRRGQ
jgi:glycosyltransferase involved in cell wall biosynthesis